jgi:hypothetical protein
VKERAKAGDVRRKVRSRVRARGSTMPQTLVLTGILALGTMIAVVAAGVRLHHEYRQNRDLLASPYP